MVDNATIQTTPVRARANGSVAFAMVTKKPGGDESILRGISVGPNTSPRTQSSTPARTPNSRDASVTAPMTKM